MLLRVIHDLGQSEHNKAIAHPVLLVSPHLHYFPLQSAELHVMGRDLATLVTCLHPLHCTDLYKPVWHIMADLLANYLRGSESARLLRLSSDRRRPFDRARSESGKQSIRLKGCSKIRFKSFSGIFIDAQEAGLRFIVCIVFQTACPDLELWYQVSMPACVASAVSAGSHLLAPAMHTASDYVGIDASSVYETA